VYELQTRESEKEKNMKMVYIKRVVINLRKFGFAWWVTVSLYESVWARAWTLTTCFWSVVVGILALSFYGIEAAVSKYSTSNDDIELLIPSFVVSILNQVLRVLRNVSTVANAAGTRLYPLLLRSWLVKKNGGPPLLGFKPPLSGRV
jgi:hypothetical protein